MSLAVFLPTIAGFVVTAVVFGLGNLVGNFVRGAFESEKEFAFLGDLTLDFFGQLSLDIGTRMAIIFGVFLAASIILFAVSFFVARKKEAKVENISEKSEVKPTT